VLYIISEKPVLSEAEWVKMQNYSAKIKNSTVSRGACGHGLFYSCKECSTNRPVFMQNKANFLKSQMDISLNITRNYEIYLNWTLGENKPNQSKFQMCLFKNGSSQEFLICAMSGLLIKSKLWLNIRYF